MGCRALLRLCCIKLYMPRSYLRLPVSKMKQTTCNFPGIRAIPAPRRSNAHRAAALACHRVPHYANISGIAVFLMSNTAS